MPCCRCSIPTATPPAASGRDWTSCDSGWGRRARLTAWPGSPWSWRGEAGARGRAGTPSRGNAALPGARAAAQHANALVIAAGARASSAWWIESWDRFCLPRPFARVDVMYSAPFGLEEGKEALRRGITVAERALRAVTYGENR